MTNLIFSDADRNMAQDIFNCSFAFPKSNEDIFYDLIFCICAPQVKSSTNHKVIEFLRVSDYFHFPLRKDLNDHFLSVALKPLRFHNNKAKWVHLVKWMFQDILPIVISSVYTSLEKRNWLVKNVKGLGMKTASHFLRNCGEKNLAIIDVHVLKYIKCSPPKNKKEYLELEEIFRQMAYDQGLTVAQLDILVWKHYSGTEWKDFIY